MTIAIVKRKNSLGISHSLGIDATHDYNKNRNLH